MSYEVKISKICEHIENNLSEDLSLDEVSSIAAVSKFHLHRLFLANKGMTLSRFVQLSRLKKASYQLAFKKELRIIDIALDAAYESPEAFTRAFKSVFRQTPSQFRKKPDWSFWNENLSTLSHRGVISMEVNIADFKETKVAVLEHHGSPDKVLDSAGKFIEWRKTTGLSPVKSSGTFGIPYSDPETTPKDEFHFDICGSTDSDIPENEYGIKAGIIPGGRCAVVRHKGSLDNVSDSIYYLYREWLPNSGEELRGFPCFFQYITLIPDVAECDLITDIYLPIK